MAGGGDVEARARGRLGLLMMKVGRRDPPTPLHSLSPPRAVPVLVTFAGGRIADVASPCLGRSGARRRSCGWRCTTH